MVSAAAGTVGPERNRLGQKRGAASELAAQDSRVDPRDVRAVLDDEMNGIFEANGNA